MKRTQKIPDIFERIELKRLFTMIDRPRLMIATLLGYFAGLRIGEVCRLRKMDCELDRERPFMKIIDSKFGANRNVPLIVPQLVPILKRYFKLVPSQYLMWSKKVNGPIDKRTLWEEFKFYLERAGLLMPIGKDKLGRIRYKYHFHTLRHTIATHMIEKGFTESYVQKFLGHKDIATVQIYTHISNPNLYDTLITMFKIEKPRKKPVKEFLEEKPETFVEIEKLKLEIEKLRLENEKTKLAHPSSYANYGTSML